jgi:hypothetical protein
MPKSMADEPVKKSRVEMSHLALEPKTSKHIIKLTCEDFTSVRLYKLVSNIIKK